MVLGDRIKAIREKRDWTQTLLAKKLGISKSVMSRIEAGTRPLEDSLLVKLVEVLDVSADYLLGMEKKEETQLDRDKKYALELIMGITDPDKKKAAIEYLKFLAGEK